MNRGTWICLGLVGLAGAVGCNVPGSARNSAIVRRVEAAGAGNIDRHPKLIAPFFDKHIDLARQLQADCSSASIHGDAMWRNTTEGMVCVQADAAVENGPGYRDPDVQERIQERSTQ